MFSSSKQLVIASHFLLSWREARILNKTKFVLSLLSSLIVLLALGPHDEPLQFDCIAIRLLNFYTHPPLPEVWLTPELREPFETYSFLVPHSLTLPEYLAQFVCKLDYYSLMFYYA